MKKLLAVLVLAVLLIFVGCTSVPTPSKVANATETACIPKVTLRVPNAPVVASLDSKPTLVYEVYVANLSSREISKVEVLENNANGSVLLSLEGDALNKTISPRVLSTGDRVLLMWISPKADAIPKSLYHRVYLKSGNSTEIAEGAQTDVINNPPIVIAPPLRGKGWLAANGPSPSNSNSHRIGLLELQGKTYIPQRYATDWMQYGDNGKLYNKNLTANEDFWNYDQNVYAVADGVVVDAKDGIPNNAPWRVPPMTIGWKSGNYLVIDIGNGAYAFYAHMIPGSPRFKIGDKVKKGEIIGKLGNAGNSDAPHLHFHMMNGVEPLFSEGIPFVFESYGLEGTQRAWLKQILEDGTWTASPNEEMRTLTLPIDGDVVDFGNGTASSCKSYSVEACPAECVVCPPCEACSSISCQSEEFCKSIGFNRSWYEEIKVRLNTS